MCGTYTIYRDGCFCNTCYDNHQGNPWGWVGIGAHNPGGYCRNHNYRYTYIIKCDNCGLRGVNDQNGTKHTNSSTKYALSCGYTEGAVVSSSMAYGGSSYVSSAALYQSQSADANGGNGTVSISATVVGYTEGTRLNGVPAQDWAAPDKIDGSTVGRIK